MLVDRTGEIGLLVECERIFDRQQYDVAASLTDKLHRRVCNKTTFVLRRWGAFRGLRPAKRPPKYRPLPVAILSFFVRLGRETEPCSRSNIVTVPPTGDRRQIMRRRHCGYRSRPVLRRSEAAALAFKPEDTHAIHADVSEAPIKTRGDRAEIFSNDDRALPTGFECSQSH